jgi:uncharacterized protein YqeY
VSDLSLQEQIRERTKAALKAGDKPLVGTLRLLSAAIKNREIEVGHELSDDEVREVAGREVKKRKESIEAFEAAGRQELVDRERAERDVLVGYAPAQLSDDAVDALIDEAIAATGATSLKEMGKVMGRVMGEARGQADGDLVQAKVKAKLAG